MRASYKWLKELCAFDASPDEVAVRFTSAGLEVEAQKRYGELPGVVIAEVRAKKPHPKSDKLSLITVFDGEGEVEVVCGAPNVPAPGGRVIFAKIGATLPNGLAISERKVAGVSSSGMICSESELDIGAEANGIFIVPEELGATPGTLVSEALELDDVVFEIGLTPNRPDCLGHVGLARELSALLGATLRLPEHATPKQLRRAVDNPPEGTRPVVMFGAVGRESAGRPVGVAVSDAERCPRYATALIEGVTVGASPFWLRYRLHVLGSRSINNVVDATNLVLLEYGHPTHAFDLAFVRGERLVVRRSRVGETVVTLDGVERAMIEDDLLICDAERALAIAGVMGGMESGVSDRTTNVVVECPYFDPRSVRRTSRRLGLHTDASHRFERGVDGRAVPGVLARVVSLICALTGGSAESQGYEVYPKLFTPREIALRSARLRALLGANIPEQEIAHILSALGCQVEQRETGVLRILAPTWRPDLTIEEDLIEEVARVWGYDRIPTETPRVRPSAGASDAQASFVQKLKRRAAGVGLTEAVNLAFCSPKQLEQARVPTTAVRVANPLSEERSVMRTSLLPGLAQNVLRAQRHQVSRVSLFELARVFTPSPEPLPVERQKLAIVLSGTRADWVGSAGSYDFYDGKGLLEAIVKPLTRREIEARLDPELASEHPYLHPRRSARLWLDQRAVGVLGELHPDVLDALELVGTVVYAELDVAELRAASRADEPPQVRTPPRFPASSRDLAIVVDEATQAGTVAAALRSAAAPLAEGVELFDLYRGGQLEAGKKSLAFRIVYRDPEATLTDQKVDEVHTRVVEETRRRFAAAVRA
jgi:phenylalanyl-tRNA synthetase beta chain